MTSWRASGLLSLVGERIALVSEAMPAEKVETFVPRTTRPFSLLDSAPFRCQALAAEFEFELLEPETMGVDPARMSGPNRFTIGSAFYHSLRHAKSEYIIFLEKV